MSDWDHVKAAVAHVVAGTGPTAMEGTAFFVGDGLALTALHVVADTDRETPVFLDPIVLTFEGGHVTPATIVEEMWNTQWDWVALKCERPPNVAPLEMRQDAPLDAEWRAFGYPRATEPGETRGGETIGGKVRDTQRTLAGVAAIQLYCDEAAAGLGAPLHGFSGAPCVIDGRVAGLLRSTLIQESFDGRGKRRIFTKAGTVFACPGSALVEFQVERGASRLQGTWGAPELIGRDFLVFLSSSEGQFKKLRPVVTTAHEKFQNALGAPHYVPVSEALVSPEAFLRTVAALCRARVVVFDATGFEPAIMLLVGIRSVVRRGLTVLSVGGEYALGDALRVPFNITDANIVSHSLRQAQRKPDPVDLLADRVARGLREMDSAVYVDNPAYDSIRRLPAERRGLIPKEEGVLVLCPFESDYNEQIWEQRLRPALKHRWELLRQGQEARRDDLGVARSLELNSPRLVTHALYEYIRRAQACVVDLTHWSENVLFELGVRLAASREGAACVLSKRWVDEGNDAGGQRRQIAALFVDEAGLYDPDLDWEEEAAYEKAYGPRATLARLGLGDGSVHRAIVAALDVDHEPASRTVFADLIGAAALFGKVQGSNAKPVALYPGNRLLTAREESAEFERLLAAWFYLYHVELTKGAELSADARAAAEHISVTLVERHGERLEALSEHAGDDLKGALDALTEMAIGGL
jgi:Trypsin-like peptidase domain